jgi:hypothetical protein
MPDSQPETIYVDRPKLQMGIPRDGLSRSRAMLFIVFEIEPL